MRLLSTFLLAGCFALAAAACGDDDSTIDTPYAYPVPDASPDDGGAGGASGAAGAGGTGATGGMK